MTLRSRVDAGLAEAVDELAVGEAVRPHRGVDARDPEAAELALAVVAVAGRVLHRVEERLVGATEQTVTLSLVARW